MTRSWIREHEGSWSLYVSNLLLGEARWRARKEELQQSEAHWLRRIQEWRALEESTKCYYTVLGVLCTLGVLSIILGVVC